MDHLNPDSEIIKTDYATAYIKDGILYSIMEPISPTLEQVKNHMELAQSKLARYLPLPCMAINETVKQSSKDVRDYMASEEMAKWVTATAVVIPTNGLTKIMINLFMKFSKPAYPTKFFNDQESAMEWLQQFKK